MKLSFIGCQAGFPGKQSSTTGFALEVIQLGQILIDVPDNTQQILTQMSIAPVNLRAILITHLHMDHVAGLCPMLQSIFSADPTSTLQVYGPQKIKKFIETTFEYTFGQIPSSFKVIELIPGQEFEVLGLKIMVISMNHVVPCIGYCIIRQQKRIFNPKRARDDGFPFGLLVKDLRQGKDVEVDGKIFQAANYFDTEPEMNVLFAFDCNMSNEWLQNNSALKVDILITEMTFLDEHGDLTISTGHNSTKNVVNAVSQFKPKKLILSHFSKRFCNFENATDIVKLTPQNLVQIGTKTLEFDVPTVAGIPKCWVDL